MAELEKVKEGLNSCQAKEGSCYTACEANGCPYRHEGGGFLCMTKLHRDALALLEPHLLTADEMVEETYGRRRTFVYVEERKSSRVYAAIIFNRQLSSPFVDLLTRDGSVSFPVHTYAIKWRLWSGFPSDDLRAKFQWQPNDCPFCGGEAELSRDEASGRYFVSCQKCGAKVMSDENTPAPQKNAEEKWNRRCDPEL